MRLWRSISAKLPWRAQQRREHDLSRELRDHLDLEAEEQQEAGLPPDEARYAARRAFGNLTMTKENVRSMWTWTIWEEFTREFRYAARVLMRNPGFTTVAVLTLALGIGANTAIFTVANTVLLRPLPFRDPDRIVAIHEEVPDIARYIEGRLRLPPEVNYLLWRDKLNSFERLSGFQLFGYHLTGVEDPESVTGAWTTPEFFTILGVQPLHGRLLEESDLAEKARVAVLSHSLWTRQFAANPKIIGESIRLSDESFTVIGVLPPSFHFPWRGIKFDLWSPITLYQSLNDQSANWSPSYTIARLKQNVSLEQARAELDVFRRTVYPENETGEGRTLFLRTLHRDLVESVREGIVILLAAVACVLVIACVNLANLLLGRGLDRRSEIAVRTVLGASRLRVVRQVLTECILLASAGGALGLLVAYWGVKGLVAVSFTRMSLVSEIAIDSDVALFTLVISLLTGLLFGALPALRLAHLTVNETLKQSGSHGTVGRGFRSTQGVLVVAETALSVVLVAGAGLMVNTFIRLNQIELGFDPRNVLAVSAQPPRSDARDREKRLAFFDQITSRVRSLPGVDSVGWTDFLPPARIYTTLKFRLPDRQYANTDQMPQATSRSATMGYFETLRIRLTDGRTFEEQDRLRSDRLLVINEAMSRKYWPRERAVGKRIIMQEGREEILAEIIGIVEDVRTLRLTEPASDIVYGMPEQSGYYRSNQILIRTSVDPLSLLPAVKHAIREVDPNQPFRDVTTLEQHLAENLEYAEPRFYTALLGAFGLLALLLGSVGLYGVLSLMVSRRTREIGLRMALGAQRGTVLRQVLREGVIWVAVGLAFGLGGALAATKFLSQFLYEISAVDAPTYIVVVLILTGAALVASYIPARRATRIDPMTALRHE